ncbi:MAG: hypothetical protein QHJ73_16595, partial [Armatimonadota bacterium]|nr:hypothetical protein [Armatimonadota bacterium]
MARKLLFFPIALALALAACAEGEAPVGFSGPADLEGWQLSGDARLDTAQDRAGGGGALRIGPGAKAIRRLRETDGAGTVEFWVYEDGSRPADPKARRVGPRWGLLQSDGRVLVAGVLYAPYLAGDASYAVSDSDQKDGWFKVQYLGLPRKTGWHRWTFQFDPEKGLSILYDGKDVNTPRPRFDWNKTQLRGFCGVAFFGDQGAANAQTVWIDDLRVTLAGAVQALPTAPPPPPPVVPES